MTDSVSTELRQVAAESRRLQNEWDYEGAARLLDRFDLSSQLPGVSDLDMGLMHQLLSIVAQRLGRTDREEWHLRRALLSLPASPRLRSAALWRLGAILEGRGRFDEAESRYLEAIEVAPRPSRGSPTSADPTVSDALPLALTAAASFYLSTADIRRAEALGAEALSLVRESVTTSTIVRLSVLGTMQAVALALGDTDASLALIRERMAVTEQRDDLPVDDIISLADGSCSQGLSTVAAIYLSRASDVLRTTPPSLNRAQSLRNTADVYRRLGDQAAAESCLRDGLSVRGLPPEVEANLTSDLAQVCLESGAHDEAVQQVRRLLQIRLEAAQQDVVAQSRALIQAASLGRQINDLAAAEGYAQRAVALNTPTKNSSEALRELARIHFLSGNPTPTLDCLRRVAALDDQLVDHVFTMGSDAQRASFTTLLRPTLALILTMATHDHRFVQQAYSLFLRRKGLEAQAVAARRSSAAASAGGPLGSAFKRLQLLRTAIAATTLHESQSGAEPLRQLLLQRTAVEKEIASQVSEMAVAARLASVDADSIANALPPGSALVDFVQFGREDFSEPTAPRRATYGAFVLGHQDSGGLAFVDLGSKTTIDRAISQYLDAVAGKPASPQSRSLADAILLPECESTLRQLLIEPLFSFISAVPMLYFSLDGELARVPFHALPGAEGSRLLHDHTVSYLPAGRDLLRNADHRLGGPPFVVADPDFDFGTVRAGPPAASANPQSRDLPRSLAHFPSLPGARQEGLEVADRLGVVAYTGAAAVKAAVLSVQSPELLHLATHAFFLPRDPNLGESSGVTEKPSKTSANRRGRQHVESPLLRCGLALAGANSWLRSGTVDPVADDGILNGEEAAMMQLEGTKLVVLSACDTALGDVKVGEGVLGLSRAFMEAGADTVIMSLWRVPDVATRLLMSTMYDKLASGTPRAEALRAAQLHVARLYPHPRDWAGFVCFGNPGPLTSRSVAFLSAQRRPD